MKKGEVRVELERAAQRGVACGLVPQAELDHPAVEDLERIERAEAETRTRVEASFGDIERRQVRRSRHGPTVRGRSAA